MRNHGTCDFCGLKSTGLYGVLEADRDQRVCEVCTKDPRVPTVHRYRVSLWVGTAPLGPRHSWLRWYEVEAPHYAAAADVAGDMARAEGHKVRKVDRVEMDSSSDAIERLQGR